MTFTLTVECDNAAFTDDLCGVLGAIIGTCADKVERGELSGILRDPNGNSVAEYSLDTDMS